MSERRAPSALRTPISRVRSLTLISMMFMITMPPTTMPIETTAGTMAKSVAVSVVQNDSSASALSTVKSFSWVGRSRWATRIASSARSIAPGISRGSAILTETTVVRRRPQIDSNIGSGINAKPSNDWPSVCPFGSATPLMVNCRPAIRIFRPMASSAERKSLSATS